MRAQDSAASNQINVETANVERVPVERLIDQPAQRFRLVRSEPPVESERPEEPEQYEAQAERMDEIVDEARLDGTNGQKVVSFLPFIHSREGEFRNGLAQTSGHPHRPREKKQYPGIKKDRRKKGSEDDVPPTPWGCEWRRTDDGWQLWRCWTERDETTGEKIKKSRYTGCLSLDAWQVMKGYDYETFISNLGQRFRRYGKR